jgi:hypothetical protein
MSIIKKILFFRRDGETPRLLRSPIFGAVVHAHPVAHEKTIAQSRDRQGADPLADARGSVRISIFGTDSLNS